MLEIRAKVVRAESFPYEVGDIFQVRVEELVGSAAFIVAFQGNLLRVRNSSRQRVQVGDTIPLVVAQKDPIVLQIFDRRASGGLNRRA